MDINFQDRIDEYLLHPDRLSEPVGGINLS